MTTQRMPHPIFRAALAIVALLAAVPAQGHQFWLASSSYDATLGRIIEVGAIAGTGFRGERKPWSPSHCVRFVARTARTLDLARAASIGDMAWARLAPNDRGGALLAFESGFTPIQLPAAAFDAYLADEALLGPLAARRSDGAQLPGRERYRRCAKAWLAGTDATRATEPVGLPLEIVPLAVPGAGPALRVRVLWGGRPLADALVKTWCAPLATGLSPTDAEGRDSLAMAAQARTDARGEAVVPCTRAGEWLVSVVQMTRCAETSVAEWESTWASLTFARPLPARASR